ncbi:integrase catalytic domain-containing protein [Trichonephila clavipes]|nr:integrase catalytic domain-containing protein [Trichonephila clavipes]
MTNIDWNFILPRSPNFGGLWESGVKSFKTHLKRVAGNSKLTLEEFITLLAEIEAVLNSRPLSPLSSDFDDFETLSPGHFLIDQPVTANVEPQLIKVKENRLTRCQRVNWLSQQIWKDSSKQLISYYKKNRDMVENYDSSNSCLCVYENVDEAVLKWIHKMRDKYIPIPGPFVIEKALRFVKALGYDQFQGRNGWL